jgi:hypothetical protein
MRRASQARLLRFGSIFTALLTAAVLWAPARLAMAQACAPYNSNSCNFVGPAIQGTNIDNNISAIGVSGSSTDGVGVEGSTSNYVGVQGNAASGTGVAGNSNNGAGVAGESTSYYGVIGTSTSSAGVVATSQQWNGVQADVYGTSGAAGVSGSNHGAHGTGVLGQTDHIAGSVQYGVRGSCSNAADYAGYFQGNVDVVGTLTKSGGAFKIDHPLDPANQYLIHSFVESPDMKNVYDGTVTLDASGRATIQLPGYFETLNRDFRYQLTSMGQFAPLYVEAEVHNNQFSIAGGAAGQKVSWQVTGIRQDPWANANRLVPETQKAPQDQGRYLHPEVYGYGMEQRIGYLPNFKTDLPIPYRPDAAE